MRRLGGAARAGGEERATPWGIKPGMGSFWGWMVALVMRAYDRPSLGGLGHLEFYHVHNLSFFRVPLASEGPLGKTGSAERR